MPVAAKDQYVDLVFPVAGVDVTAEFELQRENTTPAAVNVRGFEPGTGRLRGSSRPGLSRFIDETVT